MKIFRREEEKIDWEYLNEHGAPSKIWPHEVEGRPNAGPYTMFASVIVDKLVVRGLIGLLDRLVPPDNDEPLVWFVPQETGELPVSRPINADVDPL